MPAKTQNRRNFNRPRHDKRRGSTLLIVMVLMGVLALLGVLFYTFSAQERSNAEYYSEAAKEHGEPSLDADVLFDFALEQIIVGTNPQFKNSVLWGSRHSLLSNALGFGLHKPGDLHPFNGEGVNVIFDASNNVAVDQNRNGLPDDGTAGEPDNRYLLLYNDSPAAQNEDANRNGNLDAGEDLNNNGQLDVLVERSLMAEDVNRNGILDPGEDLNGNGILDSRYPQSDVGYTYPDINNVFLCYVGKVRDENGNVHQVVKPSYLVPGILRNAGGAPNTNWYQDATTVSRSMRAHPNHLFVPVNPTQGATVNRYLTDAEAATQTPPLAAGFPFLPMNPNYTTAIKNPPPTVAGRMGAYSKLSATPSAAAPNGDDPIEFDYDNDGDGFRESILIDLGHCVRSDAAGNKYVPMFLITIHDLDALVNLTAHGNLAKILFGPNDLSAASTPVSNTANPFGWDTSISAFNSISRSNLGLGPSEVNPFWALNARYSVDGSGSVFTQHQAFFGATPTLLGGANPPWGETANQELLWAKIGRLQFSGATVQDLYPGVYGEEGRLYQAYSASTLAASGGQSLPRPGVSLQDDNGDVSEGQAQAASTANPFPSFQHPLDHSGLGSYQSSASPKQLNWSTSGANQWIAYNRYGSNIATPSASSNVKWGQKSGLMTNTLTQGLGDDPQEIGFYAEDKRDFDNVFKPDEMLYLQLSNTEIDRLNVSTRLSKLLPFNFAKDTTDNVRGENIRKKFTTLSNDRKSFGLPSVSANAAYGRAWEFSIDPTSTKSMFPPQFGSVARYATTALAEDPFRQAVRYLLEIEQEGTQPTAPRLQRKLSLNQLLTGASSNQTEFRNLWAHPEDPGAATINSAPGVTVYPPTTTAGYEYWARRDRQQMARDIYVLLYLLGHGNDNIDTAMHLDRTNRSSPTPVTPYTTTKLAEMAQFAVNLVDDMDRDDIITRFEYDTDLSDGWNLDDDAYTSSGESNRAEVFGVERLDLSISEALAIQAKQAASMSDHSQTSYDEGSSDRHFVYVELRNHGPFDINFDSKEAWQIVMKQDASGMNPAWERRLSLKTGTILSGAAPYVIGSTDADTAVSTGSTFKRSTFGVDPSWGSALVQIAPNGKDCDLDLIEATPASSAFMIEDESNGNLTNTPGAFLSAFTGATPIGSVTAPVKFVLRRRAHPTRTKVTTTTDNPWVEVDSMTIDSSGTSGSPQQSFRLFDAGASPSSTTIPPLLAKLTSRERSQPLDSTPPSLDASTPPSQGERYHAETPSTANTIGADNSNLVSPFSIWQPHFDRDFASVMDLLLVPVFGPGKVTAYMRDVNKKTPQGQVSSTAPDDIAKSAAAKFLLPEHPDNFGAMTPDRTLDNRWHRLLEFLEVPTRTNRNLGIGTDLSIPRVPGRMNLNTFRFADNFAALLDDSRNMIFKIDGTNPAGAPYHQVEPDAGELYDQFEGTARDWWDQFLKSRDRIDPYFASTVPPAQRVSVALPGLPGSNPFRSLSDVGYTYDTNVPPVKHASVENTILRSLPADTSVAGSKRRLLEIGNATDHANGGVDPFIRNRLLSKIAGNTTTRSNSFAIFISVKYFQAVEDSTTNPAVPAIRIGGPLNGLPEPEHRGFFIVDRSKLEKGQVSGGTRYDFRDFVEYRRTLETQ